MTRGVDKGRGRPEDADTGRPAEFLLDAMVAVLEGDPDRPIQLTAAGGVYARAGYLVAMLAPETARRVQS